MCLSFPPGALPGLEGFTDAEESLVLASEESHLGFACPVSFLPPFASGRSCKNNEGNATRFPYGGLLAAGQALPPAGGCICMGREAVWPPAAPSLPVTKRARARPAGPAPPARGSAPTTGAWPERRGGHRLPRPRAQTPLSAPQCRSPPSLSGAQATPETSPSILKPGRPRQLPRLACTWSKFYNNPVINS